MFNERRRNRRVTINCGGHAQIQSLSAAEFLPDERFACKRHPVYCPLATARKTGGEPPAAASFFQAERRDNLSAARGEESRGPLPRIRRYVDRISGGIDEISRLSRWLSPSKISASEMEFLEAFAGIEFLLQ